MVPSTPTSVLEEVLAEPEVIVCGRVCLPLRCANREVGARGEISHGDRQYPIALKFLESCIEGRRISIRTERHPFLIGERCRVRLEGFGRPELAIDPIEPRSDPAPERDVGVAGRVRGLVLQVRRGLPGTPEDGGHSHTCFSIVWAPAHERRTPMLWQQPLVGVVRRRGEAEQTRKMRQDARNELLGGPGQTESSGGGVKESPLSGPGPQTEVDKGSLSRRIR